MRIIDGIIAWCSPEHVIMSRKRQAVGSQDVL
jgi:hypothetical protein